MKRLIFIFSTVALLWSFPARASQRITATVTITNVPAIGNTLTVNGDSRSWQTNVTSAATQITIGADTGSSATNLFLQVAAAPYANLVTAGLGPTTNAVQIIGAPGGAMAVSASGTWATITFSTQTVTTAYIIRVPAAAEPTQSQATNNFSQLIADIAAYATNTVPATAHYLTNYVNATLIQTIFGYKTFQGNVDIGTGSYLRFLTNAPLVMHPGSYIIFETNVFIQDALGNNRWSFNVGIASNTVAIQTDITNNLTALRTNQNAWSGTNTFNSATITNLSNSTITGSTIGGTISLLASGVISNSTTTGLSQTNTTTQGTLTANSDIAYNRVSNTSLAAGNNAGINFGSSAIYVKLKPGPGGAFTLNGIAGGRDGRMLIIQNSTGQTMTIAYDSGVDPTPANRIFTKTGADVSAGSSGISILVYDGDSSRWFLW